MCYKWQNLSLNFNKFLRIFKEQNVLIVITRKIKCMYVVRFTYFFVYSFQKNTKYNKQE